MKYAVHLLLNDVVAPVRPSPPETSSIIISSVDLPVIPLEVARYLAMEAHYYRLGSVMVYGDMGNEG